MKRLLPYLFSLIFIFCGFRSFSQDTTIVTVDNGLSIYIDYGKLLTIPAKFETKAEAGISFQLKNRFAPHIQVGWAKLEPGAALENGYYTSEGKYGRIGINYLLPLDATNSFYVGVRYAMSQYDENGTYIIGSTLWPDRVENYSRKDLKADWFEVLLGSEKRLKNSKWYLGGNLSLRILNEREKFPFIDTYAIPGYGRVFDKTVPALNIYIKHSF